MSWKMLIFRKIMVFKNFDRIFEKQRNFEDQKGGPKCCLETPRRAGEGFRSHQRVLGHFFQMIEIIDKSCFFKMSGRRSLVFDENTSEEYFTSQDKSSRGQINGFLGVLGSKQRVRIGKFLNKMFFVFSLAPKIVCGENFYEILNFNVF